MIPKSVGDLLATLGPIVVINLPFRSDRRSEFAAQLHRFGLSFDHPQVRIFEAVRPDATDGFPSIGARGCFLSHLGILREAVATEQDRILICEDDLDFTPDCLSRLPGLIESLKADDWSIFYGGYDETPIGKATAPGLLQLTSDQGVMCTHFYAIRGRAITDLKNYLEAMLLRPSGDPQGGAHALRRSLVVVPKGPSSSHHARGRTTHRRSTFLTHRHTRIALVRSLANRAFVGKSLATYPRQVGETNDSPCSRPDAVFGVRRWRCHVRQP